MASLDKRLWEGDTAGLTRRDRRACVYAVYLPDRLTDRRFVLDGEVAADVADAEAALVKLDASAAALAGTEALARLLLRAESVASSRIEGLEVEGRRLPPTILAVLYDEDVEVALRAHVAARGRTEENDPLRLDRVDYYGPQPFEHCFVRRAVGVDPPPLERFGVVAFH